jgi:hypothetical protein
MSAALPTLVPDPRAQLAQLRTELVDLAFRLERQRRYDAAEVALAISGRVGVLEAELAAGQPAGRN